jgi:hypothetical protein
MDAGVRATQEQLPTTAWTDICCCKLCIYQPHVNYVDGKATFDILPHLKEGDSYF